MKKLFLYYIFLILFLLLIVIMGTGAIVKYHYMGGTKYSFLQKTVMFITSIPFSFKRMIDFRTLNPNELEVLTKHKDKKRFDQLINSKRNSLLVLPHYVNALKASVVDIIDLNNFEVIHRYRHYIGEMNNQIRNIDKFPRIKIDASPIRFQYIHPLILDDGSLIASSSESVLFKIDFCSNLKWISEEIFHHSKMLDHEGNILVPGKLNPKTKYIENERIVDDAIFKISTDGKILYKKSIIELMVERDLPNRTDLVSYILRGYEDPIHLNDIEPALSDTSHWKTGDVFLSSPKLNAIIHYRPSNNQVINYITGPFSVQHDVDIISEEEISIFNNNELSDDNEHSEVIIYNFRTKTFKKLFNNQMQKENIKTKTQGLSHIFKDGSLLVEEQNHGRIILFNNKGEKEWEFVNKDKNSDIGIISWSRVIEDELFIENFKLMVKNKQCLN